MSTLPLTKIMIVEDHPLIIKGLRDLLEIEPTFKVIAAAGTPEEARLFMLNNDADLVIMDIRLRHNDVTDSGIELTKELIASYPDLFVLIYSDYDNVEFVRRAIEAGARGYLVKGSDVPVIRSAIDSVMAGSIYFDPNLPEKPKRVPQGQDLTKKEKEVLKLIAKWKNNEQIAEELGIKKVTVSTFRYNIMWKLGLSNSTEVLQEAIRRYGDLDDKK